ncbi:MAG: flagellar basal body L-ring protein FlgH [Syntrophales bacterium]|nr:flagellar basal body L-ring protein FlgH [Syntrophales bacterium]
MKRIIGYVMCAGGLFLLVSCVSPGRQVIGGDAYIPPPVEQPAPHMGSIWVGENSRSSLFVDRRARGVGDIVTIIVSESSTGNNKAGTDTSRNSSTSAQIDALFGIDTSILKRNENMGGLIKAGGSSASGLKGSGNTSRGNNLVARMTARVIRVLENGNLVIEGRRQVTVNAEDQFIVISGMIRPEDITSDNMIASQYISDAQILYTGKGIVNDKLRPGWLTRVVDWVWPF